MNDLIGFLRFVAILLSVIPLTYILFFMIDMTKEIIEVLKEAIQDVYRKLH